MRFRNVAAVSIAATISAVAIGMAGAHAAGSVFGSDSIRDDSIRSVDVKDGTLLAKDLSSTATKELRGQAGAQGLPGPQGLQGEKGPQGPKGDSGLVNAFYATAYYNAGDTNAGAIATVACNSDSSDFTAIAGGVQVLGLDAGANDRNTPVSSSFPGRMHWSEPSDPRDYPKANRLDGWIVQFGGNAGAVSDKDPEKVMVYALCVPGTDIPVKQTYTEN
jgi:hypothetical protein